MSITAAKLQVVVGADTRDAEQGLSRVSSKIDGLSKSAAGLQKGTMAIRDLGMILGGAVAGATAFNAAFKEVMDFGKAGAEIVYTADKFNRLSEAIDTTSGSLMGDLKQATSGMVSDAELMARAGDLMSLGLVKTHNEAVRLTKVAGGLGMNMNQLVLTLTNKTTARFDALGVSVDGFDEKVKKLEDSGMDANKAFGAAFLLQAEEQLEKVGDKADGTAASFMRLETASKNYTDKISAQLSGPLAGLADTMIQQAKYTEEAGTGWMKYAGVLGGVETAFRLLQAAIGVETEAERTLRKERGLTADAARYQAQAEAYLQGAVEASTNAVKNAIPAIDEWANTWVKKSEYAVDTAGWKLKELQDKIAAANDDLRTIVGGDFGEENRYFQETQQGIRDEMSNTQARIDELNAKPYLTQTQRQELDENKTRLQDLQTELSNTAAAHEEAMKRMAFNMLQERAASDGLTENEVQNLTKIAQHWGLWDQKTADVVNAVNQNLEELDTEDPGNFLSIIEAIMALPNSKEFAYTVNTVYLGLPPGQGEGATGRAGADADLAESITSNAKIGQVALEELQGKVEEVHGVFRDTEDIDVFKTKILSIKDSFPPLDATIVSSTTLIENFADVWNSLHSRTITLRVNIDQALETVSNLGNTGIGGLGGVAGDDEDLLTRRASGGDVRRGTPYLVGERGVELYVPENDGQIVNNATLLSVLRSMGKAGPNATQIQIIFQKGAIVAGMDMDTRDLALAVVEEIKRSM